MRIEKLDETVSTNLDAKRFAQAGDFGPLWIRASRQTNGVGRRGRAWVSQSGNLYCTGLYPFDWGIGAAARFSFVAALAVAETLDRYIDAEAITIKWPNDVLAHGKKISGILLESGTDHGQLWVAIGIGINLMNAPTDTETPAICVKNIVREQGFNENADAVLEILIERFEYWRQLYAFKGFAPLREEWLERAQGIGKTVTARLPNETITGTALGMDMNGALEIEAANGARIKIHAGDVFFD